jgi:hypothetical protein
LKVDIDLSGYSGITDAVMVVKVGGGAITAAANIMVDRDHKQVIGLLGEIHWQALASIILNVALRVINLKMLFRAELFTGFHALSRNLPPLSLPVSFSSFYSSTSKCYFLQLFALRRYL